MLTQQKLPAMVLCLGEPPGRFLLLFIFVLPFVVLVLHFDVVVLHFIFRLLYHVTGTPPWLLRPGKVSTSSELYSDYFWFSLIFHLPRALWFWVGIILLTGVFYLKRFFTSIFDSTCIYQNLHGSWQFFFEVFRASYCSSKYKSDPAHCLLDSKPEEFIFKFNHILSWITCGKKFSLHAPYSFWTLFACSKSYVKTIKKHFQ